MKLKSLKCYLELIRFNKPIGTLLLLWPTLWAIFISASGHPSLRVLIVFVLGVFLTRSAGCAINDFADCDFDKMVARTRNRPIGNSISKVEALVVFALFSISAFVVAFVYLSKLTLLLSVPALVLFTVYPFSKRVFIFPQLILGTAFSFAILMAAVEIKHEIDASVLLLFFANLFWVLGYDTIYALVDIDDDKKIKIKTSAITLGRWVALAIVVCYIVFIGLMLILGMISSFGVFYYLGITIASILLLVEAKAVILCQKHNYFRMFLLNNWVGMVILLGIILDYHIYRFN